MQLKLPFDSKKPVAGEASVHINRALSQVFRYIGENFFENYPKWAVEVLQFTPLDGQQVFVGAKAKQVRHDNGATVESVFEITEYQPCERLALQGVEEPYKQSYVFMNGDGDKATQLTFRFELLELEVFMRPFEKLIRTAIEDGAETTAENIKRY